MADERGQYDVEPKGVTLKVFVEPMPMVIPKDRCACCMGPARTSHKVPAGASATGTVHRWHDIPIPLCWGCWWHGWKYNMAQIVAFMLAVVFCVPILWGLAAVGYFAWAPGWLIAVTVIALVITSLVLTLVKLGPRLFPRRRPQCADTTWPIDGGGTAGGGTGVEAGRRYLTLCFSNPEYARLFAETNAGSIVPDHPEGQCEESAGQGAQRGTTK